KFWFQRLFPAASPKPVTPSAASVKSPFFFSSDEPRAIVQVCASLRGRRRYESETSAAEGREGASAKSASGSADEAAAATEETRRPRRERARGCVMAGLWCENPQMRDLKTSASHAAGCVRLAATLFALL